MGAKQQPDGGFKTIDVCNSRAEEMTKEYRLLEEQIKEVEAELKELKAKKSAFRKREVDNVLDYVRTYTRLGVLDTHDVDTYLCHCQNMLNGNIDGTFLTFTKE